MSERVDDPETMSLAYLADECAARAEQWDLVDGAGQIAAAWRGLEVLCTWVSTRDAMSDGVWPAQLVAAAAAVRDLLPIAGTGLAKSGGMADPTPAEIERAAAILRIQVSAECWCIEWPPDVAQPPVPTPCDECERHSTELARSVLAAVLPDHDARVRAGERRRVAEAIARDIESPVEVDLDGRHPAAVRERQINVAIARSHATEGLVPGEVTSGE